MYVLSRYLPQRLVIFSSLLSIHSLNQPFIRLNLNQKHFVKPLLLNFKVSDK